MSQARLPSARSKKGSTLPLDTPETRRAGGPRSVPPPPSSVVSSGPPSEPASQPNFPAGMSLPEGAPDWMRHGRVMAATIEAAIARGSVTEHVRVAIDRAFTAWSAGGMRPKQIAHVARLVDRAHKALRETARGDRSTVEQDCATLLYNGLPSEQRKRMHRDDVLEVVRDLKNWLDGDEARIRATAKLLGWTRSADDWMAAAVNNAIREAE